MCSGIGTVRPHPSDSGRAVALVALLVAGGAALAWWWL